MSFLIISIYINTVITVTLYLKGIDIMRIGILCKSYKENEKRYPLHWEHINMLEDNLLSKLVFETDYPGLDKISSQGKNVVIASRNEIYKTCDVLIIPKPAVFDLEHMKEGQTLWGWNHTVQDEIITTFGIEKKLTFISWENMHVWSSNVQKEHIFSRNNEVAGYAAANHFMQLNGITPGVYGEKLKVAILGYGSTARGAINSVMGHGAVDITVFSKRSKFQISDAISNVEYGIYSVKGDKVLMNGRPSYEVLNEYDLIINCVLQNPSSPVIFLKAKDMIKKPQKKYIIDISCDKGMAFDFAEPTTFEEPLVVTDKYIYYAVDHSPSYYWNAASYEISGALYPFLTYVLEHETYVGNTALEKAIDIEKGIIKNKKIITFQKRASKYPYELQKR